MKRLNPKYVHIGMIRYADVFHPSNEASAQRLHQLEEKLHCEFPNQSIPRSMKFTVAALAIKNGFELHFFEKGLGR